ncbi:MAG TPA: peptidylprolyl isomerase [Clostridiales bacterium]|nr:peptidylprolyl isomerase [Clostridiales bacterium]
MGDNKTNKNTGGRIAEGKTGMPLFAKYGLVAAAIVLVIAVGLVIYFSTAARIVATVDGEKITEAEFLYYLDYQKQIMYYSARQADPNITEETFWSTKIGGEDPIEVAKKKTLEELKNFKVQYKLAKEAGVKLTREERNLLDEAIRQQIIEPLGGGNRIKANKAYKELFGMSLDDIEAIQVQEYIVQKYVAEEIAKITDADIEKYYAENTELYKADSSFRYDAEEAVWARHILIRVEEDASEEDWNEALGKAKDLIEKLKAGEDFATLAKENSDDSSAQWGGDYLFGKGKMVEEFEQASFALEPGRFTEEPVKTEYGYHIIKLEEKYDEGEPVSLRCAKEYWEYGAEFLYDQRISELEDKAEFRIENSVYDSIR